MVEIIVDILVVSILAVLFPIAFFAVAEVGGPLGHWLWAHTPGWLLAGLAGLWLVSGRPRSGVKSPRK